MPQAGAWHEADCIASHCKVRARKAGVKWRAGGFLVVGGNLSVDAVKNVVGDGLIANTIEINVGIVR